MEGLEAYVEDLVTSGQEKSVAAKVTRHWVALSGGVDSVHLLHALHNVLKSLGDVELAAIHVNHGLSAHADEWQAFCEAQCAALERTINVVNVRLNLSSGKGIEGEAREARWQVFDSLVSQNDWLWLGHHQDDQAELLLLNLLRGTGVTGAKGMRQQVTRQHYCVIRPWLTVPKRLILESAREQELTWVEDDSNNSLALRRNFLRHRVLPELESVWPGYRASMSRFSEHIQSADTLLTEIAQQDLQQFPDSECLSIEQLNQLTKERRANLLRYWFSHQVTLQPSQKKLHSFIQQLETFHSQSRIELRWGKWRVKQQKNTIRFVGSATIDDVSFKVNWDDLSQVLEIDALCLALECVKQAQGGLRAPTADERVTVRSRQGGEKCCPDYRQKRTQLKIIYQELNVPVDDRCLIPLVFYNEELVAAPGYFVSRQFRVKENENGIEFKVNPLV